MQTLALLLLCVSFAACRGNNVHLQHSTVTVPPSIIKKLVEDKNSWAFFLQHLPEQEGPVVDYRGIAIADQQKHVSIINYDVGSRNLQQCADALMRLRAEYLFGQKRFGEIGFHFTSGHFYSYADYCKGKRPTPDGNSVHFISTLPVGISHASLRHYLDLVYTYAGTISLANELLPATALTIGTVIISPGSPGHCLIITDEAKGPDGESLFKLVEGYTPAQSIYVLRNLAEPNLGCWHRLTKGTIETASYLFQTYQRKKFE